MERARAPAAVLRRIKAQHARVAAHAPCRPVTLCAEARWIKVDRLASSLVAPVVVAINNVVVVINGVCGAEGADAGEGGAVWELLGDAEAAGARGGGAAEEAGLEDGGGDEGAGARAEDAAAREEGVGVREDGLEEAEERARRERGALDAAQREDDAAADEAVEAERDGVCAERRDRRPAAPGKGRRDEAEELVLEARGRAREAAARLAMAAGTANVMCSGTQAAPYQNGAQLLPQIRLTQL